MGEPTSVATATGTVAHPPPHLRKSPNLSNSGEKVSETATKTEWVRKQTHDKELEALEKGKKNGENFTKLLNIAKGDKTQLTQVKEENERLKSELAEKSEKLQELVSAAQSVVEYVAPFLQRYPEDAVKETSKLEVLNAILSNQPTSHHQPTLKETGDELTEKLATYYDTLEREVVEAYDPEVQPDMKGLFEVVNQQKAVFEQLEILEEKLSRLDEKDLIPLQGRVDRTNEELISFSKKITETKEDALNPNVQTDVKKLKELIKSFSERFTENENQEKELSKQIIEKLIPLKQSIVEWDSKIISGEHMDSIASFENTDLQTIHNQIEQRKKVILERQEKHTKLSVAMAKAKNWLELIKWQLKDLEIHAYLKNDLALLVKKIGALMNTTTALKNQIDEHYTSGWKPEDLTKAQNHFDKEIFNPYHEEKLKTFLTKLKKSYDDELKILNDMLEEKQTLHESAISEIVIYDKKKKKEVEDDQSEKSKMILTECESLRDNIRNSWEYCYKQLHIRVNEKNNKTLIYEIERTGYSLFDNKGYKPADAFHEDTYTSKMTLGLGKWKAKTRVCIPPLSPEEQGSSESKPS